MLTLRGQGGAIGIDFLASLLRRVAVLAIVIAPGNIGQGDETGGPGDLDWVPDGRSCHMGPGYGLPPGAMY